MKEYSKPIINEEKIKLEDIITVSYAAVAGAGNSGSWTDLFGE